MKKELLNNIDSVIYCHLTQLDEALLQMPMHQMYLFQA